MQHDRLDKFNRSVFDEWTPIQRLRLGELRRICKAYEIEYRASDKQRDLMPIVKRANDAGVFAFGPSLIANAKHPHFLTGEAAPDETPALKIVEAAADDITTNTLEPIGEYTSEWLGTKFKHAIMQNGQIIESGLSKEDAAEWLTRSSKQ